MKNTKVNFNLKRKNNVDVKLITYFFVVLFLRSLIFSKNKIQFYHDEIISKPL